MADYIRKVTKGRERVKGSIYVCAGQSDYDNSDHGHWEIPLRRSREFYDGFLAQLGIHH